MLMEKINAVIDEAFFLTDFVPLNLFMLDCRRLNKVITNLMYEIREFVTDYFKALNQKENRRYCITVFFCFVKKNSVDIVELFTFKFDFSFIDFSLYLYEKMKYLPKHSGRPFNNK